MNSTIAQEVLPPAVGMSYLAYLASFPPDLVLGAFAGSVIFLLGIAEKPRRVLLVYFVLAFVAGLLGAYPISDVLSGLMGLVRIEATFPLGMSGMISAATVINVISWLRDNPTHFLKKSQEKAG